MVTRRIVREGDKGRATHYGLKKLVPITYRIVPEHLTAEGWVVRDALLGVCDETGVVLSVPAGSEPAFGRARREWEQAQKETAAQAECAAPVEQRP